METMTSAVVLGVGVMAAAKVYTAGTKGRATSRQETMARKVVEQRLDDLDARGAERLPACSGEKGCMNDSGGLNPAIPADGVYPCTQIIRKPSLTNRRGQEQGGAIRIDTTVWAHTDPDQRSESRMVMVSACWRSSGGKTRQFSAMRLIMDRQP